MHHQPTQRGFILLPVVLMISLIAVIAFTLNNQSAMDTDISVGHAEAKLAEHVAHAGLAHATWGVQNSSCAGDMSMTSVPFGQTGAGSYTTTVTTPGGTTTAYPNLAPDQDAWFRSDDETINNGTTTTYHLRKESDNLKYAVIRFDLSTLPVGAQINSATVRLYVKATKGHPEGPVTVHRVTADWTETGATWETMVKIEVQFDSAVLQTIPAQPDAGNNWVEINLSAQVQAWVNGEPNYGIMLIPTGEGTHAEYISREGSPSQQPKLDVIVGTGSVSPVTITATGTLTGNPSPANDISHTLTRTNVPAYQPGSYTVLQPGAVSGEDAEIWDQQPDTKYGAAAETWVSSASNDTTRTLLRFNMGEIPVGAKILGATLSLLRQSGSGANQPVSAHRIRNSWSENSVTWNNRIIGTNWDTAGVDFDDTAVATTPVGPVNQRYEWNITPLAQGWVDGSYPNYGVVLVAAIAGMAGERFYTSDSDQTNTSLWPSLSITYACECGIACVSPQDSGAPQDPGKVALVGNYIGFSPDPRDTERKEIFESWGYDVDIHDDSAISFPFIGLLANIGKYDVVYVSETVASADVNTQLTNVSIGVINEEPKIYGDLELANSHNELVGSTIDITDNSHYITAPFAAGPLSIYDADMEVLTVSGTQAPGLKTLAEFSGSGTLTVLYEETQLIGGGNAKGRRVLLPLGEQNDSNFNWDFLNANGRLLVQRAIQWGIDGLVSSPPAKKVYWTDDVADKIQRSDEDGSNVEDVITGLDQPRGLDIDTINGKIYWTNNRKIQRANLDGSNAETVYTGPVVTFDIKLDVAGNKMYWTHDDGTSRVMRANLDGSNSETINTSLYRPAYLSLDTNSGQIYLTNFGDGDISRMNLDGSSITKLVSGPTGTVGNAIDLVNGKVYWTSGSTNAWIKRADLDGSNEETIVTGLNAPQDIVYDADNDRIYWGDALVNPVIKRANADGSNVETIVPSLNRPRAIVLVNASLVPDTSGGGGGSPPPPTSCNGTFRDEFKDTKYNLNDGTLSWATAWEETGETTNPTGGDIRIDNDEGTYELKVRDDGQTIMREADLSQAGAATLSFDYWRKDLSGSSDYVAVEVSYNGGSSWIELDRFAGTADDSAYTSTSYTLDAGSLSANTRIRFLTPSSGMNNDNQVLFDNIQILCSP